MMNSKKLKMIFGGTILASAIVLNSVNAVVTSSTFLKGDVNRDKKITLDDCELIKEHIMEEVILDEEQLYLADVDGENGITAADYVKLKNYIEGRSYRFLIGDVSRDGKITQDDADVLYDHISETNLLDGEQSYLADIFEDGKANGKDYIRLLEILNGTYKRYEMGDVNRDGKITQDDAYVLYDHISETNLLDGEQSYLADIFEDGKANGKDYIRLLEILNGTYKRYEMGDVNRDGKLTQEDADDIMKYYTGKISFDDEQKILGDVDGDEKINARDAKLVLQQIVANTPKGDLDYNGVVDANDASVALELYKSQTATSADIAVGDLDNNDLIDANDASLILELYKTNN